MPSHRVHEAGSRSRTGWEQEALVCVHLWIDNYKLREALEKKETQLTPAGGEPAPLLPAGP